MRCVGLVICLTFVCLSSQIAEAKGVDSLIKAMEAFYGGRSAQVIIYSSKALSSSELVTSQKAFVYYLRGAAFRDKGKFQQALKDFTNAVLLNKKASYAYCARGRTYYALGKLKKALSDLNMALSLQPENYIFLWSRSLVLEELGLLEPAVKDIEEFLRTNHLGQDHEIGWRRLSRLQAQKAYLSKLRKKVSGMGPLPKKEKTKSLSNSKTNPKAHLQSALSK